MITNLIFPSFLYSCLTTADADSYASLPIIFPGLNAALYMINNNLNNQQIPGSQAVTRKSQIFKTKSDCTSIKLDSSKLSTSNNWWQFTTGPLVDQSPSGRVDQSPSGRVDQHHQAELTNHHQAELTNHHQAVVHQWVLEQVFGGRMSFLTPTSCGLRKTCWNLKTSPAVVNFCL